MGSPGGSESVVHGDGRVSLRHAAQVAARAVLHVPHPRRERPVEDLKVARVPLHHQDPVRQ